MILKSPGGNVYPKQADPSVLDIVQTRTFVIQLIKKYEGEEEAHKKWQKFIKTVNIPRQFDDFIS